MKKILTLILGMIMCLNLASCSEEVIPDFDMKASFSFYKDADKTELFESNVFYINTKIYVSVDFSIQKNVENEEVIGFEVSIPYAEYYSTKDFLKGTSKPEETIEPAVGPNGSYTIKKLTNMNFIFDDNEIHSFNYIFEIEANQVCETAEFIVRFRPENSNLANVYVNDIKDNKAKVTYSFIEGEE